MSRQSDLTPEELELLKFFAEESERGLGTDFTWWFCHCGYSGRVPLTEQQERDWRSDPWIYAHNRESHWEYEDQWRTAFWLGIDYRFNNLQLEAGAQ